MPSGHCMFDLRWKKKHKFEIGKIFNRSLGFQTNLLILGEKLLLNKISISVGHGRNIINGQQSKSIHKFGYFSALCVNFKNTKKKNAHTSSSKDNQIKKYREREQANKKKGCIWFIQITETTLSVHCWRVLMATQWHYFIWRDWWKMLSGTWCDRQGEPEEESTDHIFLFLWMPV